MAHGYIAASAGLCRILSICTPGDLSEVHPAADLDEPAEPAKPTVLRSV